MISLDDLPDLFVLCTGHDDGSRGLHVERGRGVLDGMFDELLNLGVGEGRLGIDKVVSPTFL